eukprot:5657711-Amphidinium_carterae.1
MGLDGIAGMAPITHDIARAAGRVNTSFACMAANMAMRSILRTLAAAGEGVSGLLQCTLRSHDVEWIAMCRRHSSSFSDICIVDPAPVCPSSFRTRTLDMGIHPTQSGLLHSHECFCPPHNFKLCHCVCAHSAIGFAMSHYLQDIPWKPFPEFVQIWCVAHAWQYASSFHGRACLAHAFGPWRYKKRVQSCSSAPPQGPYGMQVPMWVISSLFLYEPLNEVHTHPNRHAAHQSSLVQKARLHSEGAGFAATSCSSIFMPQHAGVKATVHTSPSPTCSEMLMSSHTAMNITEPQVTLEALPQL